MAWGTNFDFALLCHPLRSHEAQNSNDYVRDDSESNDGELVRTITGAGRESAYRVCDCERRLISIENIQSPCGTRTGDPGKLVRGRTRDSESFATILSSWNSLYASRFVEPTSPGFSAGPGWGLLRQSFLGISECGLKNGFRVAVQPHGRNKPKMKRCP